MALYTSWICLFMEPFGELWLLGLVGLKLSIYKYFAAPCTKKVSQKFFSK